MCSWQSGRAKCARNSGPQIGGDFATHEETFLALGPQHHERSRVFDNNETESLAGGFQQDFEMTVRPSPSSFGFHLWCYTA